MDANAKFVGIKDRAVSDLVFNAKNPRNVNQADFDALKESMKNDPMFIRVRPVIVNMREGRTNTVIAGEMRLRAARELGWTTIPCAEVDIDEATERVWLLRDNAHAGKWDMDRLANEFSATELKLANIPMADLQIPDVKLNTGAAGGTAPSVTDGEFATIVLTVPTKLLNDVEPRVRDIANQYGVDCTVE